MENQKLEDFKLEIELLQKKDYQNAIEQGFYNKKDWYENIMKASNDEIAEAIINLAKRYDLLVENVANIFDSTMIMRVGKIAKKVKGLNIKE